MGIALPVFVLARQPLVAAGYDDDLYSRHRNLWIAVTLLVFFAFNFWLYIILAAITLALASTRDRAPLTLYFVVLFAAPHFTMLLPGIGPIQNLFYVNHIRMLNLAILLPLALLIRRTQRGEPPVVRLPDMAVMGFLAVMLIAHARSDSLTMLIRTAFYLYVDIWLPYYVASRAVTQMEHFRQLAGGIVLAGAILATVAVFETLKGWLVYETLRFPLGIPLEYAAYISRSEGGPLRAVVSTTYPIILGYALTFALGMYAFMALQIQPRWRRIVALLCLVGGLIAALSRGPWVGAAAAGLLMTIMGPGKGKRMVMMATIGGSAVLVLLASPLGQEIIQFLPFVGTVETANIDYRQRLIDVSMLVFWQNPVLGDLNFMANPLLEEMRQGQGIIDIVNTYLQVALPYGLLGLGFFLLALLTPMWAVWQARKRIVQQNGDAERLGRALLSIMVGILIIIATASSIGAIGTIYWLTAGLCVAYTRMLHPVKALSLQMAVKRPKPGTRSVAATATAVQRAIASDKPHGRQ